MLNIMNTLIQQIADQCIEEIEEHIDNTIHWQLTFDDETDEPQIDLTELELKIKQYQYYLLSQSNLGKDSKALIILSDQLFVIEE